MPRSPIAGEKNVPVYPLRRVQDISASFTSTPIQPINAAFPQSVHWLARSKRRLGQLPRWRSFGETSNGGSKRSQSNGRHLLHAVSQRKLKSPPDSEPRQLAWKTQQSGHKSDTLGQRDESNQNDGMLQPECHLFWAIRPRYTRPKRRRRAFQTIDHGKITSNASVSQPTAQALKRNCVYGYLPIKPTLTSVEWLEVPL